MSHFEFVFASMQRRAILCFWFLCNCLCTLILWKRAQAPDAVMIGFSSRCCYSPLPVPA